MDLMMGVLVAVNFYQHSMTILITARTADKK